MANNKKIYFYIASSLAMLIPVPGRFVYAIFMLLIFNVQMLSLTLLFHAINHLKLEYLKNSILVVEIVAITILFKQILSIICPVVALTLGFCIYLPTLTSVVLEFFFLDYSKGVKKHTLLNMRKSLLMSLFSLAYFFMRDIFGYGTITLPAWKRIIYIYLPFKAESTSASIFFATIPGSLAIIAVVLALYLKFKHKMLILDNSSFGEGKQ